MEYSAIKKYLLPVSLIFIVVSVIEIINVFILLGSELTIDGESLTFSQFIAESALIPTKALIIWILLIISSYLFCILGGLLYYLRSKENLDHLIMSKYLTTLGMLILLTSFIKLEYIILLARTNVLFTDDLTFQLALYDSKIAPGYVAALWIYFYATVCCFLMFGLVVAASGLKWTLEIEKEEEPEKHEEIRGP